MESIFEKHLIVTPDYCDASGALSPLAAFTIFQGIASEHAELIGVDCSSVLLTCAALPVALVVADDSISYVTNFFLQNDPDDDGAPSVLGFAVKSIGIGVVLAAVAVLEGL